MIQNKKRGLSPIVATILLIALAVILAMIIFLWARGWISEQIEKKGESIDLVCESVSMDLSSNTPSDNTIHFDVVNKGSVQIYSLEIREEKAGSSKTNSIEINLGPGQGRGNIAYAFESGTTKLTVYPQILGEVRGKSETRAKTCLNVGKVVNLN